MLKSAITHSTLDMQPAVLPVERDDLCVEEAAELFLLLDSEPFPTESALRSTGHVGVLHHAHVRDVPGRVEEVGSHVVQQGLVLWGVIVCAGQDMLPEVGLDLRKTFGRGVVVLLAGCESESPVDASQLRQRSRAERCPG